MDVDIIEAQSVFASFFNAFFTQKDFEKGAAWIADDFTAVIPEVSEQPLTKISFAALLAKKITIRSQQESYAIDQILIKRISPQEVHLHLQTTSSSEMRGIRKYTVVITVSGCKGNYLLSSLSVSSADRNRRRTDNAVDQTDHSNHSALSQGIICFGLTGRYSPFYISPAFIQHLGYSKETFYSLYASGIEQLIHPDDREKLFQSFVKNGLCFDFSSDLSFRIKRADGNFFSVRGIGSRSITAENSGIATIILLDEDITQAQNEIYHAKALYHMLMELTDSTLFDYDIPADRLMLSYVPNQSGERKYTLTAYDHFIQQIDSHEFKIHPADKESFVWLLQNGETINGREMRFQTPALNTAEYFWHEVSGISGRNLGGSDDHYCGIIRFTDKEKKRFLDLVVKAERDAMTGLYNKTTAEHKIEEICSMTHANDQHAVLLCDIDNFKQINDTYGHPFGDLALQRFACLLTRIFRSDDIIGRLGGDEFVVLMQNVHDSQDIAEKADLIIRSFQDSVFIDTRSDHEKHHSCSIGISIFRSDGITFKELYQAADIALYQSKTSGRRRYTFFNKQVFARSPEKGYSQYKHR